MFRHLVRGMLIATLTVASVSVAQGLTIPAEKVDNQKIYWGSAANFSKPARVSYEDIVKATPEYGEIKSKKVERGTARFWILMSQASDRAVRTIGDVGKETEYDLIAASGYLASLEPPIDADDITSMVLDRIDD